MAIDVDSSRNSYETLISCSRESCDFCDRTFKNRFQSIVHTASHIIIPLIKQNLYQCDKCLYYFTSQDDLYSHLNIKHVETAVINQENNKYIPKIKLEKQDDKFDIHEHNIERLKKETRNYKNNEIEHENEANGYLSEPKTEDSDSDCDNEQENHYNSYSNSKTESVINRLKFEDDGLFDTNILTDFITDCKVKMFNEPVNQMSGFKDLMSQNGISANIKMTNIDNTSIVTQLKNSNAYNAVKDDYMYDNFVKSLESVTEAGNTVNNLEKVHKDDVDSEPIYESVHYSNLTIPGIYVCRYCSKSFPNRLLLVQHEPIHIHIRKPRPMFCTFCDVYIAGNWTRLRRHIEREHPGARLDKKYKTYECQKCGLRFRKYMRHVIKYHANDCRGCGKEFRQVTELNEHVQHCKVQNVSSKILNVCELCFCFMKVKMNVKYTLMGCTLNEPGVRYPCSKCGKKYFELKTIKRILYGSNGSNDSGRRCYKKRESKPMSNEQRLKKFQDRLKKINLLNKF